LCTVVLSFLVDNDSDSDDKDSFVDFFDSGLDLDFRGTDWDRVLLLTGFDTAEDEGAASTAVVVVVDDEGCCGTHGMIASLWGRGRRRLL